jgi:uncharacterized protein YcbK (DUF882 family)
MRFFKESEFECKCGCGLNNVDEALKIRLDEARGMCGIPFYIKSASRCENHNKFVGGVKDSSHLKGLAVDIRVIKDIARYEIVNALMAVGFRRILIYDTFIHVDMDYEKVNPILKIMR